MKALSVVIGWVGFAGFAGLVGLGACGSSKGAVVDETDPNWKGPPPGAFASLDEEAIARACGDARLELHCQVATSDDGTVFHSCECSGIGNAEGKGRLEVTGIDEQGVRVGASFELEEGDDGWSLGDRIEE